MALSSVELGPCEVCLTESHSNLITVLLTSTAYNSTTSPKPNVTIEH